jgi:serine/threonine-protein kinase
VTISEGSVLAGKYRIVRLLGEGGMGTVFEGRHLELDQPVAIKVLRRELAADPEAVTRFSREARAASSLRSPHVAKIFDVGRLDDERPYIVMEYLDGSDLGAVLEKRGSLPLREALQLVLEACEGVAEAHERGIIHRDLKPANLFVAREGGRTTVKVFDFGISHVETAEEVRVTKTQSAFGTPLYMSPEAVRSAKLTSARTDVWALGVILYELVAGKPPFLGDTPTAVAIALTIESLVPLSQRVAGVPPEVDAVLARALAKSPADRYANAGELAAAVRGLLAARPPSAAVVARAPEASPLPARGRLLALFLGVAIVAAALTAAGVALLRGSEAPPRATAAGDATTSTAPTSEAPRPVVVPAPSASASPAPAPSASSPKLDVIVEAGPASTGTARAVAASNAAPPVTSEPPRAPSGAAPPQTATARPSAAPPGSPLHL